jgi:2-C-methyl-D-erythritol 4-phosphate cytidylyltransferase
MGEYTNLKLTTPDDMVVAEQILKGREKKLYSNSKIDANKQ